MFWSFWSRMLGEILILASVILIFSITRFAHREWKNARRNGAEESIVILLDKVVAVLEHTLNV